MQTKSSDTAAQVARLYEIYGEEYRAAAEKAGHNPEALTSHEPVQLLQVAGETFARDSLGGFQPVARQAEDTSSFVARVRLESAAVSGHGLQFSADLLQLADGKALRAAVRAVAEQNLAADLGLRAAPRAIPGYESLQPELDRFFRDHPDYQKNVFVMMRFRQDEHYMRLFEAINEVLEQNDLIAVRADQKSYPDDDDLWANIVVYMLGCRYGIAIFEDFDEREFNANVALEYGFMRALNKRVLILKEQRMPQVPTDVTANRFKEFDMMRIEETVPPQIEGWLRDIEVS